MCDFAYYFIQYKDGKIIDFIKKMDSPEPITEDNSKFFRATKNEWDLLKAVNGDIGWAENIVADYKELLNEK
jgi:hypothetical protein